MGKLQDLYVKKMINELARMGHWESTRAWQSAETNVETGNQRDAFGWGVYYQKQLVEWGTPQPMIASEPHKDKWGGKSYGREWIFDFLANDFIPETDGFCLVVANAAPYSVSHEQGSTPTGRKYRIISVLFPAFNGLAKKFKGATVKKINLGSGFGRSGWGRGRPKGSKNRK